MLRARATTLFAVCLSTLLGAAAPALAAPTEVSITPPEGARFLAGQKFDLRVEGKGTGPYSATLAIDGTAKPFSSGTQASSTTDGITSAGYGGFNARGYSNLTPGQHTLTASFTDATGTVNVTTHFQILSVGAGGTVKNVVIMLGDGMGVAHRTAARIVKYGVTAGQPNGYLAMDQFPGSGFVTTHSLNSIVTDSAPGMACYTTGNHAFNGQEGVYPAHMTNAFYYPRVEYLAAYLHRFRGTSTGIVSTADLEDATPAANAVHTGNRNAGQGIVDQYYDERRRTGLSVLLGGGRRWFLPAGTFGSSRTASNDYGPLPADLVAAWHLTGTNAGAIDPLRDVIHNFEASGFTYADNASALASLDDGSGPAKLLGLFAYGNMNTAFDKIAHRRNPSASDVVSDYHAPDQPMLDKMTAAALHALAQNPKGFVLMVEGAHIDKQSHLMDPDRAIDEVIEFDNAIGVARAFAQQNGSTLVLVLSDHECSGFSLIGALTGGIDHLRGMASDQAAIDPNTVPARQGLVGVYDAAGFPHYNILADGYPEAFDIDGKILVGFGAGGDRYESWLSKPLPVIDSLLPTDIRGELGAAGYAAEPYQREESGFGFFLRGQAFGKGQAVHTAVDIPVNAFTSDTGYQAFSGVQTNTDIFFKIAHQVFGQGDAATAAALVEQPDSE